MAPTTVSLKLLVDSTSQRVLFAEAGKDFVYFLFNIMPLPVGTVVRLLDKEGMVGSLGGLYEKDPEATCPQCRYNRMSSQVKLVETAKKTSSNSLPSSSTSASEAEGGFVKGVVTYMVMDDLMVEPMSTISGIALLNRFNIKDVGVLQEITIKIGMREAVRLLKASLQSKTVLTDLFFGKKANVWGP
ncbi:hypothetical protein DITRI_Ditri09bG0121900 [Diplodiscus trichospermus]